MRLVIEMVIFIFSTPENTITIIKIKFWSIFIPHDLSLLLQQRQGVLRQVPHQNPREKNQFHELSTSPKTKNHRKIERKAL
jgi:hypothetical protein